jgi:hypothetical protein
MGIQQIQNNANYGLYVWRKSNGKVFTDDSGNVMNIPGAIYDIEKMEKLRQAAVYYGAGDGKVEFIPGVSRVSEMRASEEKGRFEEGLIPSETDIGAWADAESAYKRSMEEGWDYDG